MAAGFVMEKVPGFGKKREMLRGQFSEAAANANQKKTATPWLHRRPPVFSAKTACVIGAGIAGASTAHRLALRGWQVTVFETAEQIAAGASGNPAAIIYPREAAADQQYDSFPQQSYEFALQEFANLPAENQLWHTCGILKLLDGNQERGRGKENLYSSKLLDAAKASEKAGIALPHDAHWHPEAGWLDAAAWCRELLSAANITVKTGTTVAKLEPDKNGWALFDADDRLLQTSAIVIIANSLSALSLPQTSRLPLQSVRGQISLVSPSALSASLKTVICHDGYLTPPLADGKQCLGATFHPEKNDSAVHLSEHAENRDLLREFLPELADSLPNIKTWQGRAALRCQSADYLPLLGPIADHDAFIKTYEGLRDGRREDYPELAALPGLYVNLAHGSKGFSQAALAAEILAAEINHEPAPVSQKVLNALHPMRFWARQLKRHKNQN